jgi:hypothetical protein
MKTVNDIAYAIDSNGIEYSVFPIWRGDTLAKLTIVGLIPDEGTGQSFRLLTGELLEDYTLLDHDRRVIRLSEMIS